MVEHQASGNSEKGLLHTSKEGRNLLSISTAAICLAPACSKDLVSDPGPAPTSQTWQSNTSATFAILSVYKKHSMHVVLKEIFMFPARTVYHKERFLKNMLPT